MKYAVLFMLLLVCGLFGPLLATSEELALKVSKALRSQPHSFHPTEEDFTTHYAAYHSKFRYNTKSSDLYAYVVSLPPECHSNCHGFYRYQVGSSRYQILSEDLALVLTTHDKLALWQREHSNRLSAFIPYHPDMKVAPEIKKMELNPASCLTPHDIGNDKLRRLNGQVLKPERASNPGAALMLTLFYPTQEQLQEFTEHLHSVINKYNGVVTYTPDPTPVTPSHNRPSKHYMEIRMSDCQLLNEVAQALAPHPLIIHITVSAPMYTHNRWAEGVCDSGNAYYTPLSHNNFTGVGQIVGVSDTGLDMFNCYFHDSNVDPPYSPANAPTVNMNHRKVIQYITFKDNAESDEGHGTHVAGSTAGLAENNFGDFERFGGMSPDAKIAFFDIAGGNAPSNRVDPPQNLDTGMLRIQYNAGARVMTNSWGSAGANAYDARCEQVDNFMNEYPDALVIFAAGNAGRNLTTRNKAASPSVAKNCLTVGASSNDHESWKSIVENPPDEASMDALAYFSSPGPTADNRLKPDVTAPGFFVQSARGTNTSTEPFCSIRGLSGTSMATPVTAGFVLKIREYFLKGYYPGGVANDSQSFVPSGALLKAMVIASAKRLDNILYYDTTPPGGGPPTMAFESLEGLYPGIHQGYGRIQMNRVLHFANASSTEPPKDPPNDPLSLFVVGAANSSSPLFAQILGTGGSRTYTFKTYKAVDVRVVLAYTDPPGNAGSNSLMVNVLTLSVRDTNNNNVVYPMYAPNGIVQSNVQVVDLTTPAGGGSYTVRVSAPSIQEGPQSFSLVIRGDISYLENGPSNEIDRSYSYEPSPMTRGAKIFISLLVLSTVFLCCFVFYVRRISQLRNTVLLDPKNYVGDSMYDFDVPDTPEPKKKSLFGKVFGSSK
eukprot:gene27482-33187_t